jgi:hypothetical protein
MSMMQTVQHKVRHGKWRPLSPGLAPLRATYRRSRAASKSTAIGRSLLRGSTVQTAALVFGAAAIAAFRWE